jgi:hypothetical protein
MGILSLFRVRTLALVAIAIVVMAVGFGFANTNTVAPSSAGDGADEISGYTIANVKYVLNATNPQNIDSVTFDVSDGEGKPATVKAKLVASGSTWYSCTSPTASAPYAYTCTTTGATVVAADELRVVAAQ